MTICFYLRDSDGQDVDAIEIEFAPEETTEALTVWEDLKRQAEGTERQT